MALTVPSTVVSKTNLSAANIDPSVKRIVANLIDATNGSGTAGTPTGATVSITQEQGIGVLHQTKINLNALPLTVRDTETGGGVKIFTFPAGRIQVLGAMAQVAFTTTSAIASTLNSGVTVNFGLGTVTQVSATLATTEQNILPTTDATSSATINIAGAEATGTATAVASFDGTSTSVPVYFNVGVASATDIDADATVTVSGDVILTWINLGDV